jgi:hypothetical protein
MYHWVCGKNGYYYYYQIILKLNIGAAQMRVCLAVARQSLTKAINESIEINWKREASRGGGNELPTGGKSAVAG